ncbi:hypothetical protein F511_04448 [Dorcoceras hygrometricum]|uniref:Uncharacterized protein n=1 Tax=Dorcoceras hygrometricum TaxID=472368 RepID=A0A2Z7CWX8_9LAMI|nr:hypothetical protein F511_04448 [Dorcoceras hygrometricum]
MYCSGPHCSNCSTEDLRMPVEDERVTLVYLISLLGSVSHYERSYHGYLASRGVDPAGGAPGGG